MEKLIEAYKKRLKTAQNLLKKLTNPDDNDARIRITAKVNCYNYFIIELERILEETQNECSGLDLNVDSKNETMVYQQECLNEENCGLSSVKCIYCGKMVLRAN